jgi:hypothetical protein
MVGAIAGVSSMEGVELEEPDAVGASFPGLYDVLGLLERRTVEIEP